MNNVIFSHGNGFPASTYRSFTKDLSRRGFKVSSIEKFGHDPLFPATIIGGMLLGLSRKAATDFSFFLAIPTLIGAGVYSLYKERAMLSVEDIPMFATGLVVSFISAWICVKWLLKYIATHSFEIFAWYRIAFGIVVLATAWTGLVDWAP